MNTLRNVKCSVLHRYPVPCVQQIALRGAEKPDATSTTIQTSEFKGQINPGGTRCASTQKDSINRYYELMIVLSGTANSASIFHLPQITFLCDNFFE